MELTKLTYPDMRGELLEHLSELSDSGYQKMYWVDGQQDGAVLHDEMDYSIHFIYDDTCLGSDASKAIGWFLKNENEAGAIRKLVCSLDSIFERYGNQLSDAEYISKPEWKQVIASAREAYELLSVL